MPQKIAVKAAADHLKDDREAEEEGGPKSRAAKKQAEQAAKQGKKAECRRLAEVEQAEINRRYEKKNVETVVILNDWEKLKKKEEEERRMKEKEERKKKRNPPQYMDEAEYSTIVGAVENMNQDGVEVTDPRRRVESQIRSMVSGPNKPSTHIALFNAFNKDVLPGLQQDKPGLTQYQYLTMVLKQWKKSPKNPENVGKDDGELRVNEHYRRMKNVPPKKLMDQPLKHNNK